MSYSGPNPPEELDAAIRTAQADLSALVRAKEYRINRYDAQSPKIADHPDLEAVLLQSVDEWMRSFDRLDHYRHTDYRRRLGCAADTVFLQQALEKNAVIQNYSGPQDEVLVTFAGLAVRFSVDQMQESFGQDFTVHEKTVAHLPGTDRDAIKRRHAAPVVRGATATL